MALLSREDGLVTVSAVTETCLHSHQFGRWQNWAGNVASLKERVLPRATAGPVESGRAQQREPNDDGSRMLGQVSKGVLGGSLILFRKKEMRGLITRVHVIDSVC